MLKRTQSEAMRVAFKEYAKSTSPVTEENT